MALYSKLRSTSQQVVKKLFVPPPRTHFEETTSFFQHQFDALLGSKVPLKLALEESSALEVCFEALVTNPLPKDRGYMTENISCFWYGLRTTNNSFHPLLS